MHPRPILVLMGTMNTVSEEQEQDGYFQGLQLHSKCSTATPAQITSAEKKAAEAKAAGTLQISYYDPNNQRKSKFKRHLTSGEVFTSSKLY